MRTPFALLVGFAVCFASTAALAATRPGPSTRDLTITPPSVVAVADTNKGCCTDADVVDYGHHIDFTGFVDGYEVTVQYRNMGLLFGEAATARAPKTVVRYDYSRYFDCRTVLNGDPEFQGWEFFIFVNPSTNFFAPVQKVGVDIGYADYSRSNFLAAYDVNGNLLQAVFNTHTGFQFLKIERPTADIARVMTGDCLGSGNSCYPDAAGSAINCLTFSTPITGNVPIPEDMELPGAPTSAGAPIANPALLVAMSVLLAGAGAWMFRRNVA